MLVRRRPRQAGAVGWAGGWAEDGQGARPGWAGRQPVTDHPDAARGIGDVFQGRTGVLPPGAASHRRRDRIGRQRLDGRRGGGVWGV